MNRFKVILIILMAVLSSCVTQRKCLQKFPPKETRDSVYIETIEKVPVYLPGDTVKISAPANCPDQDLIKYENSKLKQEISIIKGKIISNTTVKADTVYVDRTKIVEKTNTVKVPEPVKYIPPIYKYTLWICIILFVWLGFKAYKIFKP